MIPLVEPSDLRNEQYPASSQGISHSQAADLAKVELPVQPQVSGTNAYVCPRIPKELIGHTELAYSGPKNPPMVYICGAAPKEGHIVKQTINYSHLMPKDAFDSENYVHVIPLPEDSPEFPQYKQLIDFVAKKLENSHLSAPQVERAHPFLPSARTRFVTYPFLTTLFLA